MCKVWGDRVPRRLPEVRAWPLTQPDGEHTCRYACSCASKYSYATFYTVPVEKSLITTPHQYEKIIFVSPGPAVTSIVCTNVFKELKETQSALEEVLGPKLCGWYMSVQLNTLPTTSTISSARPCHDRCYMWGQSYLIPAKRHRAHGHNMWWQMGQAPVLTICAHVSNTNISTDCCTSQILAANAEAISR